MSDTIELTTYFDALDKQGLPLMFTGDKKNTIAVLLTPLEYNTERRGYLTVPAGFRSDGCSIPRVLWTTVGHPFSYKYLYEAILHDYLYQSQIFSRKTSDLIFRDELKKGGKVGTIRRASIYRALRLFGGIAWNNNQKAIQAKLQGGSK